MKYYLLLTIIFLASCTRSQERTKRLIEKARVSNPEYFKDSVRVDTVKTTVSVQIPSKPIDVGVIDSLLEEYCTPDTVERLVMKELLIERIKNICKLSALLPIETIKRQDNATMRTRIITLPDGREGIDQDCECECQDKTTTTYAPCPEQKERTILGKCLEIWPILAILILIIVAQNVLKR